VKRRPQEAGQRGPVELLEHAAELCAQDLGACALQAAASLAFCALLAWGILYCLRAPNAFDDSGLIGLGLALAYLLLKLAQNHFSLRLAARLGLPGPSMDGERWAARLRNQSAWQPWSFFVLPLCALALFPLAHASAFFHSLSLLDDGSVGPLALARRAWDQSKRAVFQLHMVHQLLFGLGFLAWVNLWALVLGAAAVAHALGYVGFINLDPRAAMNSTTLLLLTGAAWALLQPLAKAVHALRASEALAATEGQDLAARLEALGPVEGAGA
jgi:hypothetical protein